MSELGLKWRFTFIQWGLGLWVLTPLAFFFFVLIDVSNTLLFFLVPIALFTASTRKKPRLLLCIAGAIAIGLTGLATEQRSLLLILLWFAQFAPLMAVRGEAKDIEAKAAVDSLNSAIGFLSICFLGMALALPIAKGGSSGQGLSHVAGVSSIILGLVFGCGYWCYCLSVMSNLKKRLDIIASSQDSEDLGL